MKRLALLLIVILLLALGSAAVARAGSSANYATPSSLLAAGGQTASSASANYTITSTAGQPAIGLAASASYAVCSGFWCPGQAAVVLKYLFLPLLSR